MALVALVLAASPALAHESEEGSIRAEFRSFFGLRLGENKFHLNGTVVGTTASSIVVDVKAGSHVRDWIGEQATINVNADTKIYGKEKAELTLADVKVGDRIKIAGTIDGSILIALRIVDHGLPMKAFGEVTAKSDTSLTLQNNLTGVSQTVVLNEDTDVVINGEEKTTADIQVGDSGWVKFKNFAGSLIARIVVLFR